jgi:hypothetical protein
MKEIVMAGSFGATSTTDDAIEIGDLTRERLSCLEERLKGGGKRRLPVNQLVGPYRERVQLGPPYDKPKVLEQPSDLVLEIPFQLDKQSAAARKSPDGMAIEILDADLLVPSALHDAGDTGSIVAIAFVDLHLQCGLGGSSASRAAHIVGK